MLETGSDNFYVIECHCGCKSWWDASYNSFAEYLPVTYKPISYEDRMRYDDLKIGREAVVILNRRCPNFKFRLARINKIVLRTEIY